MTTFSLVSIKRSEQITGTRDEALARAVALEEEYQPAYGVTVVDTATGDTIAEIRDGIDIDADEA